MNPWPYYFAPGRARYEARLLPGLFIWPLVGFVARSLALKYFINEEERNLFKYRRPIRCLGYRRQICGVIVILGLGSCQTTEESFSTQVVSMVAVGPAIQVDTANHIVTLEGVSCLQSGWLEQIVCGVGTREHESLVATPARASDLHAALLLAGFNHGQPGHWMAASDDDQLIAVAPTGDRLEVSFSWIDVDGQQKEQPISQWIAEASDRPTGHQWVFAGSQLAPAPGQTNGPDIYYADVSGSIVGLVTFGDEVVAQQLVVPDRIEVAAPRWSVNEELVPDPGTPVTVIFRAAPPGR